MKERKKELRKRILEARCALSGEEAVEKSAAIMKRLLELEEFKASRLVMCYVDFRNEVMTLDFIEKCFRLGKRVCVPLVTCDDENCKVLKACEIKDWKQDLVQGSFGILEPRSTENNEVAPQEIDLVVVPGVVFGENRHRIGYGAGFYDRFLPGVRKDCLRVGVAFECQISSEVPAEEHDFPLDRIITEERIL